MAFAIPVWSIRKSYLGIRGSDYDICVLIVTDTHEYSVEWFGWRIWVAYKGTKVYCI